MLPNSSISRIEAQLHLAIRGPRAGGFRRVVRPADRQRKLFPQRHFALFGSSQGAERVKRAERLGREQNAAEEKVSFV